MNAAAVAVDGGELPLAGGLLALVRPALDGLAPGGVLAVLSSAPSLRHDLPAFCRLERHRYLGWETGDDGRDRHLVERGTSSVPAPFRDGDPSTGFAPRGTRVEAGGPRYPFTVRELPAADVADAAALYAQAVAAPWDPGRDVPWRSVGHLPGPVEAAVAQVMTFLAENELAALYVPARFLPRLHPAHTEVALFLASQIADEARHVDAFLRRARAGGAGPSVSSVVTARSLLALLEQEDFACATFLLSVLGEGTFLDLLKFVEIHAPDDATAEVARRARIDETRHVHFGIAHVRHAMDADPSTATRLEEAVRRRQAALADAGMPAPLLDALTVLAAGGTEPRAIARGHDAVRALVVEMEEGRRRRLLSAGFAGDQARRLAGLHTPNFM